MRRRLPNSRVHVRVESSRPASRRTSRRAGHARSAASSARLHDCGGEDEVCKDVRSGRDGDEVRVVGGVDGGDQLLQLLGVVVSGVLRAEVDHVDGDVVLLEQLAQLDELGGVGLNRTADEHDDALTLILVLAILQGKLSSLQSAEEIRLAADANVARNGVH